MLLADKTKMCGLQPFTFTSLYFDTIQSTDFPFASFGFWPGFWPVCQLVVWSGVLFFEIFSSIFLVSYEYFRTNFIFLSNISDLIEKSLLPSNRRAERMSNLIQNKHFYLKKLIFYLNFIVTSYYSTILTPNQFKQES